MNFSFKLCKLQFLIFFFFYVVIRLIIEIYRLFGTIHDVMVVNHVRFGKFKQ